MFIRNNYTTAILVMAVLLFALLIGGCATTRHVREIRADIARVEAQNSDLQAQISKLEDTMAGGANNDSQLRAELATTVSSLNDQISQLLENYNDLLNKLNAIEQKLGTRVTIKPSGGASDTTSYTNTPATQEPKVDCISTYDEAFIQVRRGEYDTAINGFREFLKNCPDHDNAENAYYWIGECYYMLEKYVDAVTSLEYLIDQYKSSPNIGRALYKLARSKQELDQKQEAITLYQRLVDDYDGTLEAEQAKERLKELK